MTRHATQTKHIGGTRPSVTDIPPPPAILTHNAPPVNNGKASPRSLPPFIRPHSALLGLPAAAAPWPPWRPPPRSPLSSHPTLRTLAAHACSATRRCPPPPPPRVRSSSPSPRPHGPAAPGSALRPRSWLSTSSRTMMKRRRKGTRGKWRSGRRMRTTARRRWTWRRWRRRRAVPPPTSPSASRGSSTSMMMSGRNEDIRDGITVPKQIPDRLLPKVAIFGRPNVVRSALFNRLVGGNRAIVVDEPGVTRDHLYGRSYCGDQEFMVADTGGVITLSKSQAGVMEELDVTTTVGMDGIPLATRETAIARMPSTIEKQAVAAVDEAAIILFITDGQAGLGNCLFFCCSGKCLFNI